MSDVVKQIFPLKYIPCCYFSYFVDHDVNDFLYMIFPKDHPWVNAAFLMEFHDHSARYSYLVEIGNDINDTGTIKKSSNEFLYNITHSDHSFFHQLHILLSQHSILHKHNLALILLTYAQKRRENHPLHYNDDPPVQFSVFTILKSDRSR